MPAHDNDLLRAETPRGDDPAQADGADADHGDRAAGPDPRRDRGVVAGVHHVRKRDERGHQCVLLADVERIERTVGKGDAERLGLRSVEAGPVAEEIAVDAGGREPFLAEQATAVGIGERHDDDLPAPDRLHAAADILDDPDRLVAHALTFDVGPAVVGPQVASADASAGDSDDGVCRPTIAASGTVSIRTSCTLGMMAARIAILLLRDRGNRYR